jgi:hypothetical protein
MLRLQEEWTAFPAPCRAGRVLHLQRVSNPSERKGKPACQVASPTSLAEERQTLPPAAPNVPACTVLQAGRSRVRNPCDVNFFNLPNPSTKALYMLKDAPWSVRKDLHEISRYSYHYSKRAPK